MENVEAYAFYRDVLGSPKNIVAPMVDQSELPWRQLSRSHGADLCYTPMFHAEVFSRNLRYREEALQSCSADRPLIIQFCASDTETFLKAALLAQEHCDAIDLNLGCPQGIARKGHYGVFLQEEWDLIHDMVSTCTDKLNVPITCKIRVFEDVEKTVRYAKMLEKAGCKLLTVHGRTSIQKGPFTGLALWSQIKAVKQAVHIPVFANGNIQYHKDIKRCIEQTGVDGVMTAEGQLHDPSIFESPSESASPRLLDAMSSASTYQLSSNSKLPATAWHLAEEYMRYVEQHPVALGIVRGHLFKLFHHSLQVHVKIRTALGQFKTMDGMKEVVSSIKSACVEDETKEDQSQMLTSFGLPHWTCQPYVRPDPVDQCQGKGVPDLKTTQLSNNRTKKLKRNPQKSFVSKKEMKYENCKCGNPMSLKCSFKFCRACCKKKRIADKIPCDFHKLPPKKSKHHIPEKILIKA